ncbi:MAG: PAS domain S-box protein [Spirochaetes bacterium]|jgi:PAS domain S-box-containing protein|nr:PAS domain S-box protein [Spirochaetota bacterium]
MENPVFNYLSFSDGTRDSDPVELFNRLKNIPELDAILRSFQDLALLVDERGFVMNYITGHMNIPAISDSILGKNLAELDFFDPLQVLLDSIEESRRSEESGDFEVEIRQVSSGDMEAAYFRARVFPVRKHAVIVFKDITSERNAFSSLAVSEEKYRILAENISDVVWIWDFDLKPLYISPSLSSIVGYTPEEYIKIPMEKLVTPSTYERAMEDVADFINANINGEIPPDDSISLDLEYYHKDGRTVWAEVKIKIHRGKGVPAYILGVTRDITQRKKAELLLREREAWQTLLLNTITDIIYTTDLEGRFTYISPFFEKYTGRSVSYLVGKHFSEFLMPTDAHRASKSFIQGLAGNVSTYIEVEFRLGEGINIPIELSVSTLCDQDGKPIGRLGVARDITERKLADKILKQSEEKYRTIFEAIQDGYYEVDLKGKILFINNSYARITGFPKEELLGYNYAKLMDEAGARMVYEKFHSVYNTGEPIHIAQGRMRRKDGSEAICEASVTLMYDSAGRKSGFCGIIRDVTERIKNEEELRIRNLTIEEDLKTAQLIQKSFIKSDTPAMEEVRIEYRYLPLEAVGGDYFSLTSLNEGGLGVFIGDVSNHGVSAALFISLVKATTDRICRDHAHDPHSYISRLNSELIGNMPLSFLTAIYGVFRKMEKGNGVSFKFCCAGHPAPLLYKSPSGEVDALLSKGTIIGVFDDLKLEDRTVYLDRGDRIFLYTDGIPEAMNARGEIWGYERMPDLIRETYDPSLSATLDNIILKINEFRNGVPLGDDVIIIGFEC